MLSLTIEIEGKNEGALVEAINEIKRLVDQGYLSGSNGNDGGKYSFLIVGEEEAVQVDE